MRSKQLVLLYLPLALIISMHCGVNQKSHWFHWLSLSCSFAQSNVTQACWVQGRAQCQIFHCLFLRSLMVRGQPSVSDVCAWIPRLPGWSGLVLQLFKTRIFLHTRPNCWPLFCSCLYCRAVLEGCPTFEPRIRAFPAAPMTSYCSHHITNFKNCCFSPYQVKIPTVGPHHCDINCADSFTALLNCLLLA